ncbi:MAG: type II toxin-antitoxin system RelE/ParE family toxin [Bryobacteraceae bacterium]
MASVHKRASAKRDLAAHYVYLAEQAGIETAERFLQDADKSFADLSMNPQMGIALSLRPPELAGLRKWHVSGFLEIPGFVSATFWRRIDRVRPARGAGIGGTC